MLVIYLTTTGIICMHNDGFLDRYTEEECITVCHLGTDNNYHCTHQENTFSAADITTENITIVNKLCKYLGSTFPSHLTRDQALTLTRRESQNP